MSVEQTALFQLNFLLWLTWPHAPGAVVFPIFRHEGFSVYWVGPSLPTSLDFRAKADAAGIPYKKNPSPDLLLRNDHRRLLLPVECKVNSFGPEATGNDLKHSAVQCASLLSIDGRTIASFFGIEEEQEWSAHVVYAVGGGLEGRMQDTLSALTERLADAGVSVIGRCALGIDIRADGIYLMAAKGTDLPLTDGSLRDTNEVKVVSLAPGEDFYPLYIIPWDPSVGKVNGYERESLEERIRSTLFSVIGSRLDLPQFQVAWDDIMVEIVELWHHWKDAKAKSGFLQSVRGYANEVFRLLRKHSISVDTSHSHYFLVSNVTPAAARLVRGKLAGDFSSQGESGSAIGEVQLYLDESAGRREAGS